MFKKKQGNFDKLGMEKDGRKYKMNDLIIELCRGMVENNKTI